MKLTATRQNLLAAVSKCTPLSKQKTTMPILSFVLIRAELLKPLTFSATNLQQSVTTRIAADVADPGSICVDARDFEARLKTLPEGPVTVELVDNHLAVTSGKRKHRIPVVDAADYPPLAPAPDGGVSVPGATLTKLLDIVRPAASDDADRPTLHGVLLSFLTGKLAATATDGRCVYHAEMPAPSVAARAPVILPLGSVEAILATTTADASATLGMGAQEFGVVSGDTVFTTKLVSGAFPPVGDFLSKTTQESFSLDPEEFAACLNAAAMGTKDGEARGIVTLTLDGDELVVVGQGKGSSDSRMTVDPKSKPDAITLSSALVLPILRHADGPISVSIEGELDPVHLHLPVPSGLAHAIIMPCRR